MQQTLQKLSDLKAIVLDVDGVLTSTKINFQTEGDWRREFSIRDGMGIRSLLERSWTVAVITGSRAPDIRERVKALKIPHFYEGCDDKMPAFLDFQKKTQLSPMQMVYVGDDLPDIPLMKQVGFAATVPEAVDEVKRAAHYVASAPGGKGAVREVCDIFLRRMKSLALIVMIAGSVFTSKSYAQDAATGAIEFPEEELAQESVFARFDKPDTVKNRIVPTEKRFELSLLGGWTVTEPILNFFRGGANATYHFHEEHALSLLYMTWGSGRTTYADQLAQDPINLDFSRAPSVKSSAFINYEFKVYYGKMRWLRKSVTHLLLYGIAGVGQIAYTHKTYPALNIGLGQKFFVNPHIALRFDMKVQANNAPIPFIKDKMKRTDPVPSMSEFSDRMALNTNLDFGLTFLF